MGNRMLVAAIVAALVPAGLAGQGITAAGHVGTLGLGADVSVSLAPRIAIRGGANFQPWEPTREIDDIDFELQLPSPTFMGAVDLYLTGAFRLSGGVVSFGSDIEVTGRLAESVEIGDETYTPQQIGSLTGVFDTRAIAPWLGLGFGRAVGPGIGFMLDLGVAFSGEPDVRLSANGPLAGDPTFQANLAQEEANLQEDASLVKLFPILSIGLSFGLR